MHPTAPDTTYFKRVLAEADKYTVDNFEICGGDDCGLDGLILFEDFPGAAASQTRDVAGNRKSFNRIVELAHESGRQVFFWHREVLCTRGMIEDMPDLLDRNGEFDLLGQAYENYLRYKIGKAFEAVPGFDGIVLTLTEADFSTLHNSRKDLYPPEKVAEKIARIFSEELKARGKRFILRSFGSISEDYEQILAGAKALAKDDSFEIETKITPFDFSPFLPDNPFLEHVRGCTLGAECDALGEFLGAGRFPAENVEDIVRYVNYARSKGVDRYVIRLDRHGRNIFDNYPVNIRAYEQSILHPGKSADEIRDEFYGSLYPEQVADVMSTLSRNGSACVKATAFAAGNVFFHQFPTRPVMKYIKAGGVLACFAPEGDLHMKGKQWGMLSAEKVPGRDALVREKEDAVKLAGESLAMLETLHGKIPGHEYARLERSWTELTNEAEAMSLLTKVICAYFDGIEAGDADAVGMKAALRSLHDELDGKALSRPFPEIADLFASCYGYEYAARAKYSAYASDFVLPGSVTDDVRVEQYMHGVFPEMEGCMASRVGNRVFPNAYLKVELKGSDGPVIIGVDCKGPVEVLVNGKSFGSFLDGSPRIEAPASKEGYTVLCRKADGPDYPLVEAVFERPVLQEHQ